MRDKMTAVIFDKDSTLAHTRHRWHLSPAEGNTYTWVDYSAACIDDPPLPGTVARMRLDWPHHQVHICSGAGGALEQTYQWLIKNALTPWYDFLHMRGENDERSNAQIKVDYIRYLEFKCGIEVVLVYEDHPAVAREVHVKTGVPVLGINPFYEEDDEKSGRVAGLRSDGKGGGL